MHRRDFMTGAAAGVITLPVLADAASADTVPVLNVGKVEVFWEKNDQSGFKLQLRKALQHMLPGLAGLEPSRFQFAFFSEVGASGVSDVDARHVLMVFHRNMGAPHDVAEALTQGRPVLLFEYDDDLPVAEAPMTLELYYGGKCYAGTYASGSDALGEEVVSGLVVKPVDDYGAGYLG